MILFVRLLNLEQRDSSGWFFPCAGVHYHDLVQASRGSETPRRFLPHINCYWGFQLHSCICHCKTSGQGQPQWMAVDIPNSRNNHHNSGNIDVVLRRGLS
jgi:hypothetical protein